MNPIIASIAQCAGLRATLLVWTIALSLCGLHRCSQAQEANPPGRVSGGAELDDHNTARGVVYVASPRALIFSGPSDDYYPTDKIQPGTRLEVYHQTEDGWLGVRPPEGSFSWIPANQAYLLQGGKIIEITSENSVSWIGTNLGQAKQFRWQVQLKPGEQLRVLGEGNVADAEGESMLWYRVAPPAGEFRWIQRSLISLSPPENAARRDSQSASTDTAPPTAADAGVVPASGQRGSDASGGVQSAQYSQSVVEGDVFATETLSGSPEAIEYYGDGGYEGEVVYDGDVVYEGDVIYEGGPGPMLVSEADHFDGWHAIKFTEDGPRMPWLRNLFHGGSPPPQYDPLAADPFSLETPVPAVQQPRFRGPTVIAPQPQVIYAEPVESPGYRDRRRPWRDPRTLRSTPADEDIDTLPPRRAPVPSEELPAQADPDPQAMYRRDSGSRMAEAQKRIDSLRAALRETFSSDQGQASADSEGGFFSVDTPPAVGSIVKDARGGAADHEDTSIGPVPNAGEVNWYGINAEAAPQVRGVSGTSTAAASQSSLASTRARSVESLLVDLSESVAKPMEYWNLEPLVQETQYLIANGSSAIERGQARLLLERIEEFQRVARQSGLVAGRTPVLGAAYVPAATASQGAFNTASYATGSSMPYAAASSNEQSRGLSRVSPSLSAKFDATGWLVAVHTNAPGQPPYALTDAGGRILAYVSTLPGMKFEVYLNQAVGVNGLRGYLPQLQAAHIQAEQIRRLP